MSKQTSWVGLYESLKPGDKLKYYYQAGNINNRLVHVRGRTDNLLIVRRWDKSRQSWTYGTMGYYSFFYAYIDGHLKVVRSRGVFNEEDQSGAPFEPKSITIPIPEANESAIEAHMLSKSQLSGNNFNRS